MMGMDVPEKAVEAAAKAVLRGTDAGHHAYKIAYAALEAAARHMPSDLEVFVRMFDEFAVNLRVNNTTDDPHNEGQAEAFTFAARQLRAALNNPYRNQP